jgi:hypothetical protein
MEANCYNKFWSEWLESEKAEKELEEKEKLLPSAQPKGNI